MADVKSIRIHSVKPAVAVTCEFGFGEGVHTQMRYETIELDFELIPQFYEEETKASITNYVRESLNAQWGIEKGDR